MNAPYWLSDLVSLLMLVLGLYSLWRLLVVRFWGYTTDYETDALHLLAGVAAAGIVSSWARTLPRPVWLVLFAAAGVYFAFRAARAWSATAPEPRRRMLGAVGCCAVLVYCFAAGVAPSTIHGSTAGSFTMAGMPGMIMDQTEHFPALGLILVVGLAFAAVFAVNRAGSMPVTKPTPVIGGPDDGAPVALAPRTVELGRVLLLLVLAYAILTKLV
ncbi:DUF5134 domain-containing protein [Actinospica durhamensis]|uniref:DUF5134 domain-containing protein n=1 Tax=Actinospica durhamensis TaxID=1508375 RepID=A0A941ELZ4_9ACTN|nr:DUF5134 domain-containing protein [Actinospica durhamensis]MBR7833395.1 DUF5134 domain-containing protein [Actinospica durhamensis]